MSKQYDLEDRTQQFAVDVSAFVRGLNLDIANQQDIKQVVRSSGSVAANYIEANESLSKKDFIYRAKICRKEAKESKLWLAFIDENESQQGVKKKLINESTELLKIYSAIVAKST